MNVATQSVDDVSESAPESAPGPQQLRDRPSLQRLLMLGDLWHIDLTRLDLTPVLFIPSLNIRPRTNGGDRLGIDVTVALGVVLLDMPEVCGVSVSIVVPVHVLEPVVEHRIRVSDCTEVAFEVLY